MVTIKCQHSGIEFEAATRRTKQHPRIATMKEQYAKRNLYREINQALDTVTKSGDYSTIDEYVEQVEAIMRDEERKQSEAISARNRAEAERKKAREQATRQREATNRLLKANGYRWIKEEYDPEYTHAYSDVEGDQWHLFAPDGNTITVKQALDAIERGLDVVRAEIAAHQEAALEKQIAAADEKQAERDHNDAVMAEFDTLVEEIERTFERVERFDTPIEESEVTRMGKLQGRYASRTRDEIRRGTINGVKCVITITGTGYDDDGYYRYYCADPDAAGLERLDLSDDDAMFESIFG